MNRFLELDYKCAVFSNHGNLIIDDIDTSKGLISALSGIKMSIYNDWATGHFYDYVFYKQDLDSNGWIDKVCSLIKSQRLLKDRSIRSIQSF